MEKTSEHKGVELSRTPIELKSGDWALKVVPWIGGRIISMENLPSGNALSFLHLSGISLMVSISLSFFFFSSTSTC